LAQRLRLHREIAYRDFIVHETRETPIPDSPMKPCLHVDGHDLCLNGASRLPRIDGPDRDFRVSVDSPMKGINGPDFMRALTAVISSRNRISRFRSFQCRMNWTLQSPDPRFSDDLSPSHLLQI
jgi:hypothetical protein